MTVMISCAERIATRRETFTQLARAGYEPHVTLSPCDPPGWQQNREAGKAAIKGALMAGAPHVLFVEDDIDLAPDFGNAVTEATLSSYGVVYLYMHDRADRVGVVYGLEEWAKVRAGGPQVPRIVPAGRVGLIYGSQAVLMTREAAFMLYGALLNDEAATDTCMLKAWIRSRQRVGIRLPHAVQHRADKTLHERRASSNYRNPENQKSLSYHLPRSLVAESGKKIEQERYPN